MSIGAVVREARTDREKTQQVLANESYVSDSLISEIERGNRKAQEDVLAAITENLDHPKLYIAAAAEVTGKVFCTPWYDGDAVDLHRVCVWAMVQEEMTEAVEQIAATNVVHPPVVAGESIREDIWKSMMGALDARGAIDHYLAVICQSYGFSIRDLFDDWYQELEMKDYIKKKSAPRRGAQAC